MGPSEEGSGDSLAAWVLLQAPPTPLQAPPPPLAPSYSPRSHSPSSILAHPPPGRGHDFSWTFSVLCSGWKPLWETPSGSFPGGCR